jgi:GntR family transcriptional regulator
MFRRIFAYRQCHFQRRDVAEVQIRAQVARRTPRRLAAFLRITPEILLEEALKMLEPSKGRTQPSRASAPHSPPGFAPLPPPPHFIVAFCYCSSVLIQVSRTQDEDLLRAREMAMKFRLDMKSGVPVYRQIIDQVHAARASGTARPGDQLPTVRQLAVDLSINPNTVVRAYRELELTGVLSTQQGTGTFITDTKIEQSKAERERRLDQLVSEFVARAGREGFTVKELRSRLKELGPQENSNGRHI